MKNISFHNARIAQRFTNQITEKQRHVSRFYAHYQNNKCSGKNDSCRSRDPMIDRGMDLSNVGSYSQPELRFEIVRSG